jgi:chromosomal replication initiator protein
MTHTEDLESWNTLGRPRVVLSLWRGLIEVSPKAPTVDTIQKMVATYYGLSQSELISERRARSVARPRQVGMWLAKQLTRRSLPDIGYRFGGRDHTTVIHAVRQIEKLRGENPKIHEDSENLVEMLGGRPL